MTDEEYREFLVFLFERYVRPRIPRIRRRFHHHMMEEWCYHLAEAERAAHVLRYIESYCDDDDDVYRTFTYERLTRAISDTRYSLDFNNRVCEEAGFLDIYEAHEHELLAGLQPQHLPEADKEILKEMGSLDADIELRAMVYRVKALRDRLERNSNETPARRQLHNAAERVAKVQKEFEEARKQKEHEEGGEKPKTTRRWFKGLGQIGQGAAISIANIALAIGAINFPVSPETQTWGAVASVTTGIGTILSGIGDLRNG